MQAIPYKIVRGEADLVYSIDVARTLVVRLREAGVRRVEMEEITGKHATHYACVTAKDECVRFLVHNLPVLLDRTSFCPSIGNPSFVSIDPNTSTKLMTAALSPGLTKCFTTGYYKTFKAKPHPSLLKQFHPGEMSWKTTKTTKQGRTRMIRNPSRLRMRYRDE